MVPISYKKNPAFLKKNTDQQNAATCGTFFTLKATGKIVS
jgi:hypothetical protein